MSSTYALYFGFFFSPLSRGAGGGL